MQNKIDLEALKSPPRAENALHEVLGYLNFSNGKPDAAFARNLNGLCASLGPRQQVQQLQTLLLDRLESLRASDSAFANSDQADAVIRLALDDIVPAYRRHHADLLFHLAEDFFEQPFFLARVFEAVLAERQMGDSPGEIVSSTLKRLNDFLGYRPLAVLENERRMEPYAHERFRPVPLYIRGAGVSCGKYSDLLTSTVTFLSQTPPEILGAAHFYLDQLEELSVDVRAHDHHHPANKRTNYMFGEWDPHLIDTKGRYQRFVVRRVILDVLLKWMDEQTDIPPAERLYDASAVLSGTILMASAISGSGPHTHDSTVSLTTLLPVVARQRDAFYSRLLSKTSGTRAQRLQRQAELTRQPFGHVRQYLNIYLAENGQRQILHRQLARLYSRMGFPEAAQSEVSAIPTLALRFESEVARNLIQARRWLNQADPEAAFRCLTEVEDWLQRGIECGALVDPWNILGFQGMFPLFASREDSIPDPRAETLLELMDETFDVSSRTLGEAAAQGNNSLIHRLTDRFRRLADQWDTYATTTVEDLPAVHGHDSWESAVEVAHALTAWQSAGAATGDIAFWRNQVDRFRSPKAYAQVVDILLRKQDHVAALGLMMQWLSQAEEVGLESGSASIHTRLFQWMKLVTAPVEIGHDDPEVLVESQTTVNKMFDYLEANAGMYWNVPDLDKSWTELALVDDDRDDLTDLEMDEFLEDEQEADDDEFSESLFEAAYDGVVFRDSAWDGHIGDVLDDGNDTAATELEQLLRELEPRLTFLQTLCGLWQNAAASAVQNSPCIADDKRQTPTAMPLSSSLEYWHRRARELELGLRRLLSSVWAYQTPTHLGEPDSNLDFVMQLHAKFDLLHLIIATIVRCRAARRTIACGLPADLTGGIPKSERSIINFHHAMLTGDTAKIRRQLPRLLQQLSRLSLLYVPFDHQGQPKQVLEVRFVQSLMKSLLTQLPRLGLYRETWFVLQTAFRMERNARLDGQAVSEFDRLARIALVNTLEGIVRSSQHWQSGSFPHEELVEIIETVVGKFQSLWDKHSRTMRISSVEGLRDEEDWNEVKQFIEDYGADLFHARWLTFGNVRAILHEGVIPFLDYLEENEDPLHPMRLLQDLEEGEIDEDSVVDTLELVYESVMHKFDRFFEYSTTTTQSDYGEKFYCLLDFLRLEADYDREAWTHIPRSIAHEVLARCGQPTAVALWEQQFRRQCAGKAKRYLDRLERLENRYGMRLPSVTDRLNERFVKPLAVNRMLVLIPPAMQDSQQVFDSTSESFERLRAEMDQYLQDASGSGTDVPPWLETLEEEVQRQAKAPNSAQSDSEWESELPRCCVNLKEMRRQLRKWNQPLEKPKRSQKRK